MKQAHVIDLFSGAGGFSAGAELAGAKVVYAVNHWPMAVDVHQKNHPSAVHSCQDVNLVNWNMVPNHDIMLASPCCQGHSRARGGRDSAHSSESRQTAWSVVDAVTVKRPTFLVIENVPEFAKWEDYDLFMIALKRKGYALTENILNASEFGVPQNRERLFIVGSLGKALTIKSPNLKPLSASSIIEWEHPDFNLISKKTRAEIVMRQVENGRKIHGDRFLVVYNGSEKNGRSVDKPMPTITCNDRIAVVNKDKIRFLRTSEIRRAMSFSENYIMPTQHKETVRLFGNAVCPLVAKEIVTQILRTA